MNAGMCISLCLSRADLRLLGALRRTESTGGRGVYEWLWTNEWKAFISVSLHLSSCLRKALEKQCLFRGSLGFQHVFFVSSKKLHVTQFDNFSRRKGDSAALQSIIIHVFIAAGQIKKRNYNEIIFESKGAPWCFRGPTQLAYSAYREDRLCVSLFFTRSLSLYLFLALALFLSYSLKTILVGTLCLNLIVLIPAEHPLNKYFGQRKGIEPAILCVLISSLVSPYRMGNCVCVLLHFKLTAFHLMGRIIHRRRNRLQAKVQVMADV